MYAQQMMHWKRLLCYLYINSRLYTHKMFSFCLNINLKRTLIVSISMSLSISIALIHFFHYLKKKKKIVFYQRVYEKDDIQYKYDRK